MSFTPRERMLAACRGEPVDRPPVWLMRQAGRYLPEYRAMRAKHSFWEVVRTPEYAVEVTLQPLRRYPVDAAIIFCDILVIPEAMGAGVEYPKGGPIIKRPFKGEDDLKRLNEVNVAESLSYVGDAIRLLSTHIHPKLALIGFAGAPLTLAAYLIEGAGSKDIRHLKAMYYEKPDLVRRLLEGLADKVADLLRLQVEAGADIVQVFDSWAGLLCPADYEAIALPAVKRVFSLLADLDVPKVLYLRGAASHLKLAATSGADVFSIDQSITLAEAREILGPDVPIQGNMDPAVLLAPADYIKSAVESQAAEIGYQGWIANLGQGIVPDLPPEGIGAYVDAVVGLK
jgi:uroporphyrinogen decarboxylase